MNDAALTPAESAEFRFLRQQVDRAMDARFRADAPADAANTLQRARDELRDFVAALRKKGRAI